MRDPDRAACTARTLTGTDEIMADARRLGYALVDQELDLALPTVAVPLRAANGHALGSIDISVSAARSGVEQVRDELAPRLLELGREISYDLGYRPPLGDQADSASGWRDADR